MPPPAPCSDTSTRSFLGLILHGEYVPDAEVYVLSYPGVAFTFPMKKKDYSASKDVSLLHSSAMPNSMAVFSGDSWTQARETMRTAEILPSVKTFAPLSNT